MKGVSSFYAAVLVNFVRKIEMQDGSRGGLAFDEKSQCKIIACSCEIFQVDGAYPCVGFIIRVVVCGGCMIEDANAAVLRGEDEGLLGGDTSWLSSEVGGCSICCNGGKWMVKPVWLDECQCARALVLSFEMSCNMDLR